MANQEVSAERGSAILRQEKLCRVQGRLGRVQTDYELDPRWDSLRGGALLQGVDEGAAGTRHVHACRPPR